MTGLTQFNSNLSSFAHNCFALLPSQRTPAQQRGKGGGGVIGLDWSGCIVRIRLWPGLPHGCHHLLSIMRHRTALSQRDL